MKKIINISCILVFIFANLFANAQEYGNGNITTQVRQVGNFNKIDVGCAIKLYLTQGTSNSVKVETDENLQPYITTQANGGVLVLSCKNIRSVSKMNVYVTFKELKGIECSGAASVKANTSITSNPKFSISASGASKVAIEVQTDDLTIDLSGASAIELTTQAPKVTSELSGASRMNLKGKGNTQHINLSGSSSYNAGEFESNEAYIELSSVSKATVSAQKLIRAELSGVSRLSYYDKSGLKTVSKQGNYEIRHGEKESIVAENDTADETLANLFEDDISMDNPATNIKNKKDTIRIKINNRKIIEVVDSENKSQNAENRKKTSFKIGKNKWINIEDVSKRYKAHWFGIDIGMNGFFNNDNRIDYPSGYNYLNLNYSKSIHIGLNLLQYSIPFYKDKFGMATGLGISWNNYRFDKNVILSTHNDKLIGNFDTDPARRYEKSKLVVSYLEVPLLLGFQTGRVVEYMRIHGEIGIVGGVRIGSHTKIVYNDGSRKKDKNYDDFYIAPLKADAFIRLGLGHISLYGKYSLTELFRNGKGPVIHPFSVGFSVN